MCARAQVKEGEKKPNIQIADEWNISNVDVYVVSLLWAFRGSLHACLIFSLHFFCCVTAGFWGTRVLGHTVQFGFTSVYFAVCFRVFVGLAHAW